MSSCAKYEKLQEEEESQLELRLDLAYSTCLPQATCDICHGGVPHRARAVFLVLGSYALVVLVLEGAAIIIGTQQQIFLGYILRLIAGALAKQTISKGLEALRGALRVRVTELEKRGIPMSIAGE